MSSPGSPSLAIERRVHAEYGVVATVVATCLAVPWCISALSVSGALLLSLGSVGSVLLGFWRLGWLGGDRALRMAIWTSDGEWRLIDVRGKVWPANLLGGTLVTRFIVWLRFDAGTGRRQMIVMGAGSGADLQRRLVVRLRSSWRSPPHEAANP